MLSALHISRQKMLCTDWNSRLRPNTEFYFESLNWLFGETSEYV